MTTVPSWGCGNMTILFFGYQFILYVNIYVTNCTNKKINQQLFQCVTAARNGKGKSLTISPFTPCWYHKKKFKICHYVMNEYIFQTIFILIHTPKSVAHCCGGPEILWYPWHWYACCCRYFGNTYQFGYSSQWCIHQPPALEDEVHEYLPQRKHQVYDLWKGQP